MIGEVSCQNSLKLSYKEGNYKLQILPSAPSSKIISFCCSEATLTSTRDNVSIKKSMMKKINMNCCTKSVCFQMHKRLQAWSILLCGWEVTSFSKTTFLTKRLNLRSVSDCNDFDNVYSNYGLSLSGNIALDFGAISQKRVNLLKFQFCCIYNLFIKTNGYTFLLRVAKSHAYNIHYINK